MSLAVGVLTFLMGAGLVTAGVYALAGLGWALISGALPCFLISVVILRGSR